MDDSIPAPPAICMPFTTPPTIPAAAAAATAAAAAALLFADVPLGRPVAPDDLRVGTASGSPVIVTPGPPGPPGPVATATPAPTPTPTPNAVPVAVSAAAAVFFGCLVLGTLAGLGAALAGAITTAATVSPSVTASVTAPPCEYCDGCCDCHCCMRWRLVLSRPIPGPPSLVNEDKEEEDENVEAVAEVIGGAVALTAIGCAKYCRESGERVRAKLEGRVGAAAASFREREDVGMDEDVEEEEEEDEDDRGFAGAVEDNTAVASDADDDAELEIDDRAEAGAEEGAEEENGTGDTDADGVAEGCWDGGCDSCCCCTMGV